MPLEEPGWWYGRGGSLAERLLGPAGDLYGAAVERRFRCAVPYRAGLPVLCVGNFTAGGTGKTPLTRFLIGAFRQRDVPAACLTRGYGGRLAGPVWVDATQHTAEAVGDEPLLIAQDAPVMVARARRAGLGAIEAEGRARVVIMDDGLQNPTLVKDLSIAVVDARRGIGNGRVIPAGPLRARLAFQLGLVDCVVVMGADPGPGDGVPIFEELKRIFHGPVLRGRVSSQGETDWMAGQPLLAYAGIANPERFFGMLEQYGPSSVVRRAFADHHPFREEEAARLLAEAEAAGAALVTTEKDLARLAGAAGARGVLRARSRVLPIAVEFDAQDLVRLQSLIDGVMTNGDRG